MLAMLEHVSMVDRRVRSQCLKPCGRAVRGVLCKYVRPCLPAEGNETLRILVGGFWPGAQLGLRDGLLTCYHGPVLPHNIHLAEMSGGWAL